MRKLTLVTVAILLGLMMITSTVLKAEDSEESISIDTTEMPVATPSADDMSSDEPTFDSSSSDDSSTYFPSSGE